MSTCFLHPKDLRQGDGFPVAGIMENAEDHRVAIDIAQCDRLGTAQGFLPLRFVIAEDIGLERTFATVGPGRLVVGNSMTRHQQGGDGVDQSRFSGADITGEQAVFSPQAHCPDPAVKGPPIEDFQPLQAKPGQPVIGQKFQKHRLSHSRLLP